jgi:hypothetical protein
MYEDVLTIKKPEDDVLTIKKPEDAEYYAFMFSFEGKELISISEDGTFRVNGKETANDKKLYEAFVEFFRSTGHYV